MGAAGLKIDPEYGGLGFNHREYVKVMQLVASQGGNVTALLSAARSKEHAALVLPAGNRAVGAQANRPHEALPTVGAAVEAQAQVPDHRKAEHAPSMRAHDGPAGA